MYDKGKGAQGRARVAFCQVHTRAMEFHDLVRIGGAKGVMKRMFSDMYVTVWVWMILYDTC